VQAVAVSVLRAEKLEIESRWQCKALTRYHLLIACPQFLLIPAEEKGDVVATASLCRGCHGIAVRACPFREELNGLCAKAKCKRAHHQLRHVGGKLVPAHTTALGKTPLPQISCSSATCPAGDTVNKDDGRETLHEVLGHRVSGDADDP
jgi:hypothetical protein